MSSVDLGAEHMKELERLIDSAAAWPVVEKCSSLLGWLPEARVPAQDTTANRARAFRALLGEIVDDAHRAYVDDPGDSAARDTLAVGALLGLVTWGPGQARERATAPSASREVRRGLAGSWLDPPVQADTIRRRENKARLLTEFRHRLHDWVEPVPEPRAEPAPGPRAEPLASAQPVQPAQPVQSAQPVPPVQPAQPVQSAQPAPSGSSDDPPSARPAPRWWSVPLAWSAAHRRTVLAGAAAVVIGAAAMPFVLQGKDGADEVLSIDDVARAESAGSFVLPLRLDLTPAQLDRMNHDKYWQGGAGHTVSFTSWFDGQKAVWAENSLINVTLSGATDKTVRITRIDIDRGACRAPAGGGTLFYAPVGGSGEDENIGLLFDLDLPQPVAMGKEGENYFSQRAITLEPGEAETISLFVSTHRQDCEYRFRLRLVVPGGKKAVTRTIPEKDSPPFRLTALATNDSSLPYSAYRAMYVGGAASPAQGAFVPADPLTYDNDPATLTEARPAADP
ncbi:MULTISPECIES: hypothetical protein [unclassified Streptomyces]|uniref:hypothetical protein n=1 Tax=unclassified Streptomyces TaxID=2593676 RepID=UPI000364C634|nr:MULTISPECIES: hypothetical protein [unclassified Streptomyces]MYS38218.1 hypothetical protein [Streptomyces sp. SID4920]MYX66409.1 hypothetical protein [Streptomyces sp. SID8373]